MALGKVPALSLHVPACQAGTAEVLTRSRVMERAHVSHKVPFAYSGARSTLSSPLCLVRDFLPPAGCSASLGLSPLAYTEPLPQGEFGRA